MILLKGEEKANVSLERTPKPSGNRQFHKKGSIEVHTMLTVKVWAMTNYMEGSNLLYSIQISGTEGSSFPSVKPYTQETIRAILA